MTVVLCLPHHYLRKRKNQGLNFTYIIKEKIYIEGKVIEEMKNEDMASLIEKMRNAIGEDNSAKISEDLATIVKENTSQNAEIETQKSKITQLETDKTELLKTNGSLLQQITVPAKDEKEEDEKKKEENKVSIDDIFDEKGNFKD